MSKKPSRAARRRSALAGWATRRKNERKHVRENRKLAREPMGKRSHGPAKKKEKTKRVSKVLSKKRLDRSRDSKTKRLRSEAAKKGWRTRRRREKEKKRRIISDPRPKRNREYFVVLLFKTRKNGKPAVRRLREAIVTLPDGATDEEIKKAYADWMLKNEPRYSAQDIYRLVFAENRGRSVNMRIVPRDEPTSQPAQIRDNDARHRGKRKAKKRKS